MGKISEELQALRKRAKIEAMGSKEVPIDLPAPLEQISPMVESPISTPAPTTHSPETIRIRRALSPLFLHKAERDFCEASSDRSDEITENLAELVEPGILDMDYDSLMKRSVYASFQALHFSSAAARARRGVELREDSLKAQLSDWKGAHAKVAEELDFEVAAHAKDLLVLETTRAELKIAENALKSLDEKMLQLLDKVANMERESEDTAVQYTLMARIAMMLEPAELKATWNVQEEIEAFKLKFPESNLEEWGVPEVVDIPTASK